MLGRGVAERLASASPMSPFARQALGLQNVGASNQ
jgi:hypothetical protein